MPLINHENIDKWLFDYVEGKLNGAQKRAVQDFLQAHPYYKEDLEAWENATVTEAEQPYPYTEQLLTISRPSAFKRYSLAIASLFLLGISTAAWYYFSASSTRVLDELAIATPETATPSPIAPVASAQSEPYAPASLPEAVQHAIMHPQSIAGAPSEAAASQPVHSAPVANHREIAQATATIREAYSPDPQSAATTLAEEQETETSAPASFTNTSSPTNSLHKHNAGGALARAVLPSGKAKHPAFLPDSYAYTGKPDKDMSGSVAIPANEPGDLALSGTAETPDVQEAHTAKKENLHKIKKRKKFNDYELGLYNSRDHVLLTPGRMNLAEYAAFAGSSTHPTFHANLRNQWTGSENQLLTLNAAYDQYSKKLKGAWGIGFETQSLDMGLWKQGAFHLYYSPKFRISKSLSIEPGVAFTYARQQTGRSLSMPRSIEPARGYTALAVPLPQGQTAQPTDIFDLSLSTLVQARRFYAAVGVDHLLSPMQNVYTENGTGKDRLPRRYKAVIGTDYRGFHESRWVISPQVSLMQQGSHFEVWGGSLVRYDWVMAGASVSHQGQFTSMLGVQTGAFRLAYQFDLTRSQLTGAYYGSHEATLRFSVGTKQRKFKTILDSEK